VGQPRKGDLVRFLVLKWIVAAVLALSGAFGGLLLMRYSEADDAPGGVVIGMLVIVSSLTLGVLIARRKTWRT
jgi:hypothetical protein